MPSLLIGNTGGIVIFSRIVGMREKYDLPGQFMNFLTTPEIAHGGIRLSSRVGLFLRPQKQENIATPRA